MSSSREKIGSRVYKLFLLTLLTLTSFSLEAKEISSAFGLSLGEIYTGELQALSKTTTGDPIYEFEPENPHPTFTKYGIIITSKTKRIVSIWAWTTFEDSDKCKAEFNVIEVLLDKKYKKHKYDNVTFAHASASYRDKNRGIFLKCPVDFPSISLYLQYVDADMQELLVQETAESQDSDGL